MAPPADVAPPADEIPPDDAPPAADEDIGVRNVMLGDHHKGDDDWWFGLSPSADETPADECCPATYATLPDRWNDGFKLEVRVEPWIRGRTLKIEFPALSVVGPSDVGSIDVTVKQQGELWNARPIVPGWTYPELSLIHI